MTLDDERDRRAALVAAIAVSLYSYNCNVADRAAALWREFNGECADLPDLERWCLSRSWATEMPYPTARAYLAHAIAVYGAEAEDRVRCEEEQERQRRDLVGNMFHLLKGDDDEEAKEVHPPRADHEAAPTAGHEGDHEGRAVEPRPEAAGVAAVGPGVAPGSVGTGPGLSYRDAMGITHARALGLLPEAPAPKGPDRSGHAAGCEVGRCAKWCPMLKPIGAP